jgi:hypothetical protein
MSDDCLGMGMPGFIRQVLQSSVPSGATLSTQISTILSFPTCTPVVSRSKNANGLLSFKFIF